MTHMYTTQIMNLDNKADPDTIIVHLVITAFNFLDDKEKSYRNGSYVTFGKLY